MSLDFLTITICSPSAVFSVTCACAIKDSSSGSFHEGNVLYFSGNDVVHVADNSINENKEAIISLRENLKCVRIEELRNKKIEIHYDIEIPNMDKWDLQATIANAKKITSTKSIDERNINLL